MSEVSKTIVKLMGARLAFPHLFVAQESDDGGSARYTGAFIIPPDHPQLAEVKKAMQVAAKTKWKEDAEGVYRTLEKKDRLALHDGDDKAKYAGYRGNLFINGARQEKDGPPLVIGADKMPLTAKSGKPYSGCYVNASLEFWAMDHPKNGQRVCATIRGVQFAKDGEAFGGSGAADAGEFDAIEGTEAGDFA